MYFWCIEILLFYVFRVGVDVQKIDKCIGDIEADAENPVLKDEQEAQVSWLFFLSFLF